MVPAELKLQQGTTKFLKVEHEKVSTNSEPQRDVRIK